MVMVDQENPVPPPERGGSMNHLHVRGKGGLRGNGTTGKHSSGTVSVVVPDEITDKCK